jgi:glycosyltransferase involved in cell wall biosynthesis
MAASRKNKKKVDGMVTVIMPAFNEEKTIKDICARVLLQESVGQLVIVDDCSSDRTLELALSVRDPRVEVLKHAVNQGKGAAIRTAQNSVRMAITLIQDADLEYDPSQYPKLIAPILSGHADVVYGSRFQTGEMRRVVYFWHYVGNKVLTVFSNAISNINLSDMETCYKVIRSDLFKSLDLRESRFGFEPELTAKLAARKARFYEVSISYFGRTYEEGKKIGAKDGFRALYCILKYNLWARPKN